MIIMRRSANAKNSLVKLFLIRWDIFRHLKCEIKELRKMSVDYKINFIFILYNSNSSQLIFCI